MPPQDDRKSSFCSERMKLCQKHLAKVYGRSKDIFLRARGEKESTSIYPTGFINENSRAKNISQRSMWKGTRKTSPYLSAVSGLFDGPTLFKKFQWRSLQSSVTKISPESQSASCPKFCKHDELNADPVPVFFKKPHASRSVSHPVSSWASSATANRSKDSAPRIEKQGDDMGLLTACCGQCSLEGDTGWPTGRTRQCEMKTGLLPSRIGILPEDVVSSRQKGTDVQAQLEPSNKWSLIDSGAEIGTVPTSGIFGTLVRKYQQSRSVACSTSVIPSKKSKLGDTGKKNLYCAKDVSSKPLKRLQEISGFVSRDNYAGIDGIEEAKGSCFFQNPHAQSCISNLTPIRTREAPGNHGADEDSSPSNPLLKYPYQGSELSEDTCESNLVECTQAKRSNLFSLASTEPHDTRPLWPKNLSECTISGQVAVSGLRCEPTPGNANTNFSSREVLASGISSNNPDHLARVTKSSMKRLEKSSNHLWKYGSMALCTENTVRDYTTGSPPDFRVQNLDRNVSWSKSGGRKMVNHVCQIIKQHRWGPVTLETLDGVKEKLSPHCINAVIQQINEASLALRFFNWAKRRKGYKHDVYTYTTMINVLGCARDLSSVRRLLKEMHKDGCEPVVITYNTLILIYGKVKSLSESLRVFRIMKEAGCQPDIITYSILIHLCIKSGFLQEALKLYQSMLGAGIQPDTITYSIVIDSLGKAGSLREARKLCCEMKDMGYEPNEFTYNSLIGRHAKSGETKYSLGYYQEMRKKGFPLNSVVCTTIMSVLASLEKYTEAEGLFSEMHQAGIVGDSSAYSVMINMWGQAGNLDKAMSWYGRMLRNMVSPSLTTFTALVDAHLDLHLYEGAQHFLTSMAMWGISPDLKVYTSLLRHCTGCERQDHVDAVLGLMDRLAHPAHKFVFELLTAKNQSRKRTRTRVEKFLVMVQHEGQDSKRAFANALIDFLHKLQCKTDPGFVWELAVEKGVFPPAVIRREAPSHWLIDLHSFSVGTALVALPRLLLKLREKWVQAPTKRVYIVIGWGKHRRVTSSSAIKQPVNDLLQAANSPFSVDQTNAGVFVSHGVPFCDWISIPLNRKKLGLDVAI